jgi:hypothetical protein
LRTESDIRKKLAQARFRHLKKRVRTSISRRPQNCVHNRKLGDGSTPERPAVGVCMLNGDCPDGVCDDAFGGRARAAGCPSFTPPDPESVKLDFEDFLSEAPAGEIAYLFPDMAALLWVLDTRPDVETDIPDGEDIPRITPPATDPDTAEVMDLSELEVADPWYVLFMRKISGR